MSDILFRCPKCKTSYALESTEAGKDFKCDSCGNSASVPVPDVTMKCGRCQTELATSSVYVGETFDCPNCEGSIVVPKKKLTFKKVEPSPPSPVVMAHMQSLASPRRRRFKMPEIPGWFLLLVAALIAGGAYMMFAPTPPPPNPDPAKGTEYEAIKSGLMAIYSIDQLEKGNYDGGFAGLEYARRKSSAPEFSSFLSRSNYVAACTSCKGTGEIRISCSACLGLGKCPSCLSSGQCPKCTGTGKLQVLCSNCHGSGKCQACGGRGQIETTRTVTKREPLPSMGGGTATKTMGVITRAVKTQEKVLENCTTCRQTGQCHKCDGTGKMPSPCTLCSGTGQCLTCKGAGKCAKCGGTGGPVEKCEDCAGVGSAVSRDRIAENRAQVLSKIESLLASRQSHEPRSEEVRMITDSLHGMAVSNALMAVDPNEDLFFRAFDNTEPAVKPTTKKKKPEATEAVDYQVDATKMNLFDGIIRQSREGKMEVSIDPDAAVLLAGITADRAELRSLTTGPVIQEYLAKQGFYGPMVSFGAGHSVLFVTTPSLWAYSTACGFLGKGDLVLASAAIDTSRVDSGEYGRHCRALKTVIDLMMKQQKKLGALERDVDEALRKVSSAAKGAAMGAHAPQLAGGGVGTVKKIGGESATAEGADARLAEAQAQVDAQMAAYNGFLDEVIGSNGLLWDRFQSAYRGQLHTECVVLLAYMLNTSVALQKLGDKFQAAGFKDVDARRAALVPSVVVADQKIVKDERDVVQASLNDVAIKSGSDAKLMAAKLNEVFAIDRANQAGRVGSGYVAVGRHTAAINSLLANEAPDSRRISAVERELRAKSKRGLLRAFQSVSGGAVSATGAEDQGNTVVASTVCAMRGEMFALSVRTELASRRAAVKKDAGQDYWGVVYTREEEMLSNDPVTFGGYGEKDPLVRASAIEALKWACFRFPAAMWEKGIHVEFRNLYSAREGDPVGAAIAVAAYSSLTNKPIRQSVALTGDFRSDGSILPVGWILQKVSAAALGEGIEVILVPRANEPDLVSVPLDDLCRVTIVSSDDVDTYIQFATDATFKKQAIDDLQRAQALILLGRGDEAANVLKPLAGANRELYSARRLLDLLSVYGERPAK